MKIVQVPSPNVTDDAYIMPTDDSKPISLVTKNSEPITPPPSTPTPLPPSSPIIIPQVEEKRRPTATVEPQQQTQNQQQELAVRCSVIKRLPQSTTVIIIKDTVETLDLKHPVSSLIQQSRHIEPEQEQPIDYHIPKRRSEYDDDEFEKKTREARRTSAIISRPILSMRHHHHMVSRGIKVNGIMSAAAGHGRSNGSNSQSGSNQSNSNNCGSFSGGGSSGGSGSSSGGSSGGGGVGGGSGAGGGMGGRDGRSNYGPNSPPTGSLPPFYESLKGGNNGMNAYNANNGNYMSSSQNHVYSLGNGISCDGSQELTNIGSYTEQSNNNISLKNYSMNAAYGLIMKDEQDLEYESKFDPLSLNANLLPSGYGNYDMTDSMMVDMNGSAVDPLQFTATLTFSSPAEHALLDNLTDAVDLSSFLQRLPNDDHSSSGNDLELSSNPSLTPDSVSITPVDNQLDSYTEHLLMNRNNTYDRQQLNGYSLSNKMYNESPPSYQQSREMNHLMGGHNVDPHHHHQLVSSGMSFDLDQQSNMSLPSPSGASSLDGSQHGEYTSSSSTAGGHKGAVQQTVSSRRNSSPLITDDNLLVLSQRVSIKYLWLAIFFNLCTHIDYEGRNKHKV